jgi:hypothetical protein
MTEFETLIARLDLAYESFKIDQQNGAIHALAALLDWMQKTGATPQQTMPLNWLGESLTSKRTGNQKPTFDAGRDAIPAAVVSLLMEQCDLKLKDACVLVSKEMRGAMTYQQLRTWRENIHQNRTQPEAQQQYYNSKARFKEAISGKDMPTDGLKKAILEMVRNQF